jgi:periplasmic protein TonB
LASLNGSAGAHRLDDATSSDERSRENSPSSGHSAKVRSGESDISPAPETKPTAKPEVRPAHSGEIGLTAPRSLASRNQTPTMGAVPHLQRPSTILVTLPSRGSQPFRVSFPEKAVAATSSLALTSQLSVLVSPEPGPAVAHKPARLEAGGLVSFLWPHYPRPGNRYGLAETIRVRVTIGQRGQVLEVKFLSGSTSLLPATTRAIRQWRYKPTLLDKRPVQAQQDITIEFRPSPPQYSSQVLTHHLSHN